ncbi:hypothetical protein [Bradyrhizobium sp. 169]|uniref:hypothetical protein n=1 Tax=Bradyrhizobium sp. 169 TaxID=2782640 RepID=UPI001FF8817B|nr:hypothetical protein [Bradyrhizobium sp. 169]MCK1590329.1 hypothetical protein [Bradyrhizobium sp. 169]
MSKRTKDRTLKSSTALSKSSKKDAEVVDLKIEPPKRDTVEAVDPLVAVANIPETLATERPDDSVAADSKAQVSGGDYPTGAPNTGAFGFVFPWAQQAQLLQMAETNTRFMSHFVALFIGARSPQDLLAITADFSKEGAKLFQEQSNATFTMLVGQPAN